ncbi:MAG TPA: dihydrofolate reductase family protein, partial [Methanoculleus sp.]|nr:dihydrofolate reductase family protein [Methanoculleus sp.]
GKRIVAVSRRADMERVAALGKHAVVVIAGDETVDLAALLAELYRQGVRRLMVEGGGTLIWALFAQGLVDELQTFVGNIVIGGKDAPTPADGDGFTREVDFTRLRIIEIERLDDGLLVRWSVEKESAARD